MELNFVYPNVLLKLEPIAFGYRPKYHFVSENLIGHITDF